jgi:hypothetical protein
VSGVGRAFTVIHGLAVSGAWTSTTAFVSWKRKCRRAVSSTCAHGISERFSRWTPRRWGDAPASADDLQRLLLPEEMRAELEDHDLAIAVFPEFGNADEFLRGLTGALQESP